MEGREGQRDEETVGRVEGEKGGGLGREGVTKRRRQQVRFLPAKLSSTSANRLTGSSSLSWERSLWSSSTRPFTGAAASYRRNPMSPPLRQTLAHNIPPPDKCRRTRILVRLLYLSIHQWMARPPFLASARPPTRLCARTKRSASMLVYNQRAYAQ